MRDNEMVLKNNEVTALMQFVASVKADKITCDGCFEHVPELAESQLGDKPLTEILEKVQNHLNNCPCCAQEYETFLTALDAISESA